MKSLKIIISLSLLMFYVSIINVDAKENLNEVYGGEYVLTDEEILENEQIALEFAKNQHRNHQARMDEIVENWVKDGSGISNESPKGLVFNQAPGGYKYGAGGRRNVLGNIFFNYWKCFYGSFYQFQNNKF